jgi:hypothetical protein
VITADQLVCHAVGDYILQSHWMATEKVKRWWPALVHAVTYSLPFLLLGASPLALLVIAGTHALIDRYRLARWVCWARNVTFCPPDEEHWLPAGQAFPGDTPPYLATWLVIIADNTIHVLINGAALRWL